MTEEERNTWKSYLNYMKEWINSHSENDEIITSPLCGCDYDEIDMDGIHDIIVEVRIYNQETKSSEIKQYEISIEDRYTYKSCVDCDKIISKIIESNPKDFKGNYSIEVLYFVYKDGEEY